MAKEGAEMKCLFFGEKGYRKRCLQGTCRLLVLALVVIVIGCATSAVRLSPSEEVKATFTKVDINPDEYAFFTTGPDAAPEAVLIIENRYLADFDSSGWKLRDKQGVMDLLKAIASKPSEAKKFGFPVRDAQGTVKGKMFTTFRQGKVFLDKKEGTFSVATPAMLDTGMGTAKRTGCSISICQ
jgi:hypothetical protein